MAYQDVTGMLFEKENLRSNFMTYIFNNLENIPLNTIATCLNLAFSDYLVPLNLTDEQWQSVFKNNMVDLKNSFGAFYEGMMVGVIINSCNIYNGYKAVFDVATGVIPAYRKKGVFTNMFAYALENLKQKDIERYYLEVLQDNDKAIKAYKKHGFVIAREMLLIRSAVSSVAFNANLMISNLNDLEPKKLEKCIKVKPSYEHCLDILKNNIDDYAIAYMHDHDEIKAFCIYDIKNGRIMQMGYADIDKLKNIIGYLSAKYQNITIKNVDSSYQEIIKMLQDLGFETIVKQYEMVRKL